MFFLPLPLPRTCRADDQGGRLQISWGRQWSPLLTLCTGSVTNLQSIKIQRHLKQNHQEYFELHFCFWRWSSRQHRWQLTAAKTVYTCRSVKYYLKWWCWCQPSENLIMVILMMVMVIPVCLAATSEGQNLSNPWSFLSFEIVNIIMSIKILLSLSFRFKFLIYLRDPMLGECHWWWFCSPEIIYVCSWIMELLPLTATTLTMMTTSMKIL